jgi:hypothetical protein
MRAILLAAALLAPGLALAQSAAPPAPAPAMTPIEQSAEYRFQLDLHVNEAALAKFLPAGWTPNVAASGAAKDCNLRVIFIDRTNIVAADGKVIGDGTNRLVYLAVPVKSATSGNGQIIIAGLTENNTADAFGVLTKASRANVARSVSAKAGVVLASEAWDFAAASGEHLRMSIKFVPAPANRGGGTTTFINPKNPAQLQFYTTVQATDIARNVTTTPPDRVKSFTFKGGGGATASLFDGTEKVLSWDSQRWYVRTISNPAP